MMRVLLLCRQVVKTCKEFVTFFSHQGESTVDALKEGLMKQPVSHFNYCIKFCSNSLSFLS